MRFSKSAVALWGQECSRECEAEAESKSSLSFNGKIKSELRNKQVKKKKKNHHSRRELPVCVRALVCAGVRTPRGDLHARVPADTGSLSSPLFMTSFVRQESGFLPFLKSTKISTFHPKKYCRGSKSRFNGVYV